MSIRRLHEQQTISDAIAIQPLQQFQARDPHLSGTALIRHQATKMGWSEGKTFWCAA